MFRCTKDEVLQKRRTSSFFVVFGKFRKGVEQPVRPPCVPAGADSPADCPQGRGRVPSGAPKMRLCENTKPHLFCCFRKVPEGSRTACPAALRPGRGGQSSGLSARARESPFRRTTTALSELSFLGSDNCFLYCIFFDDTAKSRDGRLLVWKRPSRLFMCPHRLCGSCADYMRWQCGGNANFLRRKSMKIL